MSAAFKVFELTKPDEGWVAHQIDSTGAKCGFVAGIGSTATEALSNLLEGTRENRTSYSGMDYTEGGTR